MAGEKAIPLSQLLLGIEPVHFGISGILAAVIYFAYSTRHSRERPDIEYDVAHATTHKKGTAPKSE